MNTKYLIALIAIVILAPLVWMLFLNTPAEETVKGENTNQPNYSGEKGETINMAGKTAVFETNLGNIEIELDADAAPLTSQNFVKLIQSGFYNGLIFHRVIPGFVIQGGDPNGDGTGGPGYTVPAEINLPHLRGSVAMARLSDQVNPERDSSGSQFYIALEDLAQLDGQYTVFGKVVSGMETVDEIATAETDQFDKPLQNVIINKAYLK